MTVLTTGDNMAALQHQPMEKRCQACTSKAVVLIESVVGTESREHRCADSKEPMHAGGLEHEKST